MRGEERRQEERRKERRGDLSGRQGSMVLRVMLACPLCEQWRREDEEEEGREGRRGRRE